MSPLFVNPPKKTICSNLKSFFYITLILIFGYCPREISALSSPADDSLVTNYCIPYNKRSRAISGKSNNHLSDYINSYIAVIPHCKNRCNLHDFKPCQDRVHSHPVIWISFEGKRLKNGNLLTWHTFKNINVSHFEIQKNTASNVWEDIGIVNESEARKNIYSYSFNDINTDKDSYYRIKLFYFDGNYSYSDIIHI